MTSQPIYRRRFNSRPTFFHR